MKVSKGIELAPPVDAGPLFSGTGLATSFQAAIPGLHTPRRQVPEGSAPRAKIRTHTDPAIAQALKNTINTPNAKILVTGYSPTGGGHTDRMLNVIDKAIVEADHLPANSTLIIHVPEAWDGKPRAGSLETLAAKAQANNINVIALDADKSVIGFLDKTTGGSDDGSLVTRFAELATRKQADTKTITKGRMYDGSADFFKANSPAISANNLMRTLADTIGKTAMGTRVKVLTDMAPDLHKAAEKYGVPGENRVDQQNHGILLDLSDARLHTNFETNRAILMKVLNTYGGLHSHIGLGDRNSLTTMQKAADTAGITQFMSKQQAMQTSAAFFLADAKTVNLTPPVKPDGTLGAVDPTGILKHESVVAADQVDNIVFVYAHANQPRIAAHVEAMLQSETPPPGYENTLFVFAGKGMFTANAATNALHMAYLGDADGISTMGAGVAGEMAYLHKPVATGEIPSKAGLLEVSAGGSSQTDGPWLDADAQKPSQSGLLALPIKGHNEQLANARNLQRNTNMTTPPSGLDIVPDTTLDAVLNGAVDKFVQQRHETATAKYGTMADNMEAMFTAFQNPDTYVQHTYDLLFQGKAAESPEEAKIRKVVAAAVNLPRMSATMGLIKMAIQVANRIEDKGALPEHPRVDFDAQKGDTLKFKNFDHFMKTLQSDRALSKLLGSGVNADKMPILTEIRNTFATLSAGGLTPQEVSFEIHALKERLGEHMMTGFGP